MKKSNPDQTFFYFFEIRNHRFLAGGVGAAKRRQIILDENLLFKFR
ncbi:MAG: hypothetical protein M3Z26_02165 [Bacteroidota bacterium]|nr:hypothetical protein [Bacteroidota bacterium]